MRIIAWCLLCAAAIFAAVATRVSDEQFAPKDARPVVIKK